MWVEISSSHSKYEISPCNFWNGVRVWIDRPHILNPKVFGTEIKHSWRIKYNKEKAMKGSSVLNSDCILMLLAISCRLRNEELPDHFRAFLETLPCENVFDYIREPEGPERQESDLVLQIRTVIPKHPTKFQPVSEILVFDKMGSSVIFASCADENCALSVPFPYRLMCSDGRIKLAMPRALMNVEKYMDGPTKWLKEILLPKVARWCTEIPSVPAVPSLVEVPVSRYSSNYHKLKAKYGRKLVEMWPECTDPLKYVYEDIGIAAYLVTLWEEERKLRKKNDLQTFVDLGCGNGLLVYILTSEGHKGYGIDVRKRNIWDCYGPETKLVELALTPSDSMLFPDSDWIIGNHSDELTPWIPVIAARSSYKTRAFILPCCLYTFDGKYQRVHADKSSYQSYLDFIQEVCSVMGFHVKMDKLRIASVKRICFLCMSRSYELKKESHIDAQRTEFISAHSVRSSQTVLKSDLEKKIVDPNEDSELKKADDKSSAQNEEKTVSNPGNQKWASSFEPRGKKIIVQNCSNLNPDVLSNLMSEIMKILLRYENFIAVLKDEKEVLWNAGGHITFVELAKALSPESLSELKHQCGGLQTLLRNHRNIFMIDEGKISLTIPSAEFPSATVPKKKAKRSKMKKKKKSGDLTLTRPCFFHLYHPNGCPISLGRCTFKH